MATGLSPEICELLLEWLGNIGTPTQPADSYYFQWHTGDPGAAGTANTTASFSGRDVIAGSSEFWVVGTADDGEIENKTAGQSSNASGAATITYFSCWDASTSGNFLFSGTTTSKTVAIGEKLTYGAGDMTVAITGAA